MFEKDDNKFFMITFILQTILFSKRFRMEGGPPRRRRRLDNHDTNPRGNVEHYRVKNRPCCFCQLDLDVRTFENHIQGSDICRSLYMSWLGVSSIDGVLLKTFNCIFCPAKCYKLTDHLLNAPECKNRYFQRLDVDNLR